MAHPCPNCDMRCHCGGDIDDCEFEGTKEQMNCTHCDVYDWEDDDDYSYDEFCENCGEQNCRCEEINNCTCGSFDNQGRRVSDCICGRG